MPNIPNTNVHIPLSDWAMLDSVELTLKESLPALEAIFK
jgi:hypothetical protein